MLCSNHEKIRLGDRATYKFWSRKGRTANKIYAESGETNYAATHFKGRKPKTFRDWR